MAGDYMLDSPTNNYATLNPLDNLTDTHLSEGNLKASDAAAHMRKDQLWLSTSGKWYFEVNIECAKGWLRLSKGIANYAFC
jgi:hypothetical protein